MTCTAGISKLCSFFLDSLLLMSTTAAAALLAGAGLGLVLALRGSVPKLAQLENEISETRERAHLADRARVAAETQAEGKMGV